MAARVARALAVFVTRALPTTPLHPIKVSIAFVGRAVRNSMRTTRLPSSLSSPTAIENKRRAGHQRRGVGGEKDDRSGDFVKLAEAAELDLRQHFISECL